MQFTLKSGRTGSWSGVIAALLLFLSASSNSANAESVFVNQIGGGAAIRLPIVGLSGGGPGNPAPTPETTIPRRGGLDSAANLMLGNYNKIIQLQAGTHDRSAVGILGGSRDKVNLLQEGNGLRSNILLLNTSGVRLNFVQPPGAAPVDLVIAHLPNGGWFVKR